jgi:predicted acyltransferase (DUF342 family)
MSSSWRQYGGKSANDYYETLNVGTVIADRFLTRNTSAITNTFDNINVLGESIIQNTAQFGANMFGKFNLYVSNDVFINKRLYFGTDLSGSFNEGDRTYMFGNTKNIGINTLTPNTTFHISGLEYNILTVDTTQPYIRNIIGQNVNKYGVVVGASDQASFISFYNDSGNNTISTNKADSIIQYTRDSSLNITGKKAIDLSASTVKTNFDSGYSIMDSSGVKFNINQPYNIIYSNGAYNNSVLINASGQFYDTSGSIIMSAKSGKIRFNAINTELTSAVSYDSSNVTYLYDAYDISNVSTGDAMTLYAKDTSSNTLLKALSTLNMGMVMGGGAYPYDLSRSLATIGLIDVSGKILSGQTIVSGNNVTRYLTTTGINTYAPKTENYVLDINGPTRIGNGEINTMKRMDFEIKRVAFSKIDKLHGIAAGTASTSDLPYTQIICYTDDGGITWNDSIVDPNNSFFTSSELDNQIKSLAVYDKYFSIIGSTQSYLFFTNNGGETWNRMIYSTLETTGTTYRDTLSIIIKKYDSNYRIFISFKYTNSSNTLFNAPIITRYYDIPVSVISSSISDIDLNTYLIGEFYPALTINNNDSSGNILYFSGFTTNNYGKIMKTTISDPNLNIKYKTALNINTYYNQIYSYDDNYVIAVGNNILTWTLNGGGTTGSEWNDITFNANLQSVYIYDLSYALITGASGEFYYTNSGPTNFQKVPDALLNTSGIGERITKQNNKLIYVNMYDINSFLIGDVTTAYNRNSEILGKSKVLFGYFPNLFNRDNNKVFDVSGNMIISGDIYINDVGKLKSNNPNFYLLYDTVQSVYIGSPSASTTIFGNLYAGADVSFNSRLHVISDVSLNKRLFVNGDVSLNSNLGVQKNITVYNNRRIYSNHYDVDPIINGIGGVNNGFITIGDGASDINIGTNQLGIRKDIRIGGGGFSGSPSVSNRIYVGGVNDTVIFTGPINSSQITITQLQLKFTQVNGSQSGPTSNSGSNYNSLTNPFDFGAGLYIKDSGNNYAGVIAVSNDTSGYYFKAPGSDNILNLNVGTLKLPSDGRTTSFGLNNDIKNGILVLTSDADIDNSANYAITVKPIDISNIFLRDPLSVDTYQQIQTNVGISGDLTVMFNKRLIVTGDVSLNGNVVINKDLLVKGRLAVQQYSNQSIINTTTTNYKFVIIEDMSINGRLAVSDDVTILNRTFLGSDVSMGSRLFVGGDVSMNARLFVGSDVSMNARLFVGGDASFNSRIFVVGDVSLNNRLLVGGDVSLNSNLSLTSDLSMGGRLFINIGAFYVGNSPFSTSNIPSDASINQRLNVLSDVSFNKRLFVDGDASLNSRLYVRGDASFNGTVFADNISWVMTYLINPPPAITFGTPTSQSDSIYIPWTNPPQINVGSLFSYSYLPVITSFTCNFYGNISGANTTYTLLSANTNANCINTTSNTVTALSGILITNNNALTPGFQTKTFPDSSVRTTFVYYNSAFTNLQGNTNSLTAYYRNNSTTFVSSTISSISTFKSAGVPSAPTSVSYDTFTSTSGNNYLITVNVNVGPPTTVDVDNPTSTSVFKTYKVAYETAGSTRRYGGAVSQYSNSTTGALGTSYNTTTSSAYPFNLTGLLPDCSYALTVTAQNTSTNTEYGASNSIYTGSSGATSLNTIGLIRLVSSFPSFAAQSNNAKLISNSSGVYVFNNTTTTVTLIDSKSVPIHSYEIRGGNATDYPSITVISGTVTGTGVIDTMTTNITYKGFGGTLASTSAATTNVLLSVTATQATDSYSATACQGFYLQGQITVTCKSPTVSSSANKYTATLNLSQPGITGGLSTLDRTFDFYYEAAPNTPTFGTATLTWNSTNYSTMSICGINIIYNNSNSNVLKIITPVAANMGTYFYRNGNLIEYSFNTGTSTTEADSTINNATTSSGTFLSGATTFTHTFPYTNTSYTTSITSTSKVFNFISGNAQTTATLSSLLFDNPSYDIYDIIKAPIQIANFNTLYNGCRVNIGKYSTASFRTPTAVTATSYSYSTAINGTDGYSEELQLANGLHQTITNASNAYSNYSTTHPYNSINYSNTVANTGYRYATFVWKLSSYSNTVNNIEFKIIDSSRFNRNGSLSSTPITTTDGILIKFYYKFSDNTVSANNTTWISGSEVSGMTEVSSSNYTNYTGDRHGISNSGFSTYADTIIVGMPLAALVSTTLLHCVIGLPMNNQCSFKYIRAKVRA